jgi:fructoselysine 6-kinase
VDRSHLHQALGGTAEQDIQLGPAGERSFPPGGYRAGVLAGFQLNPADRAFIRSHEIVAVPYFRQIEHLYQAVIEDPEFRGRRVVDLLDGADLGPGFAELEAVLARSDLTFLSADPELADQLVVRGRQLPAPLVVTHGAQGCSVVIEGRLISGKAVPVPQEECRDSTGCGDAFQAAFTIEYFRSGAIDRAIVAGAQLAATVLRHLGAVEQG